MNLAVWIPIVAALATAPIEPRFPDAKSVYFCGFEADDDVNFDEWPDGWTRRLGAGFPHYLPMGIVADPTAPQGERCFQITLDGGGGAASGPPQQADWRFSYVFEGYLQTDGLRHSEASFALTFLDAKYRRLESHASPRRRSTDGWQRLTIGPVSPRSAETRYVVIDVVLAPGTPPADLRGSARFDNLWLGRLPRLTLSTDRPHHLFVAGEPVVVTCDISGIAGDDRRVRLELLDVAGQRLAQVERELLPVDENDAEAFEADEPLPISPEIDESLDGVASRTSPALEEFRLPRTRIRTAQPLTWTLPIAEPGYYRVRLEMPGNDGAYYQREMPLVVVAPAERAARGEFGWSLLDDRRLLEDNQLIDLLTTSGVHWVKLPLWHDEGDDRRAEQLGVLADRLTQQSMTVVGVLEAPPAVTRALNVDARPSAAATFSQPVEVWYPSLEDVLARFALKARAWQLGRDGDTSFIGYPDLPAKLAQIKGELDRIAQDAHVSLGWNWSTELPEAAPTPWRYLSLTAEPPLTSDEMSAYLSAKANGAAAAWVHLEPLDRRYYDSNSRVADLVQRMLAAKIHGAAAVFVPRPFDDQVGLFNEDGTPGELYLPWRTVALELSGARYLGALRLPGRSRNHVFARGNDLLMVVWNERGGREQLFLGQQPRAVDVWGRRVELAAHGGEHAVPVGPLPVFVGGLNGAVAHWRLAAQLQHDRIPSLFGVPHENALSITNPLNRTVHGQARIVAPAGWVVEPSLQEFTLAAGETIELPFRLRLPPSANTGPQPLRVDFEILGDQRHRFSAYEQLEVGLGDVLLEVSSQLTADGVLEVEQRLINRGDDTLSFRCHLYAPNERRLRWTVVDLGPGEEVHVYPLRDGERLLGETLWLRADEIGGQRVLSQRFVAGQDTVGP